MAVSLTGCLFFTQATAQTAKKLKTIVVDAGHGGKDGGAFGEYENSMRSNEKDITLGISKKLVAELKKQLPDVKTIPTRTTDVYQDPREKASIANDANADLFICIHADAVGLKTGRRQIGSKTVTKYKVYYTGKGRKKVKHTEPYDVEIPSFQYYKIPTERHGTSVWILNTRNAGIKDNAIAKDIQFEASSDSVFSTFNSSSPEVRQLAQVYSKRNKEKSDRMAGFVMEEIAAKGRDALGIFQRPKGIWVLEATNMPAILIETGFISNPGDEQYLNSDKGQQELAEAITKAVLSYKQLLEAPKVAQN